VIDLHSHLLPGVDDGSRSVERSVVVLREMARLGVTDICLTPHLRASRADAGPPEAHAEAFEALRAAAPAAPRLHRGAEIMLDQPFGTTAERLRRVSLGGTRYLLVEFAPMVSFDTVVRALRSVVEIGLTPVVAHPERYSCCSAPVVVVWRELGARMQVDATTLLGTRSRGTRARELVAQGLADILAGDNHGDNRTIATGRRRLEEHGAAEQAELLTTTNPAAILKDAPLVPVPPFEIKQSLLRRIRSLFDSEGEG
jgi:protein-tyrosine phosphatase